MVSVPISVAILAGILAGATIQLLRIFHAAARAWKDAKEKREARIKPVRWDG